MTIRISSERERFVRSLIQDGRYASESEVVDEALRLLEEHDMEWCRGEGTSRYPNL